MDNKTLWQLTAASVSDVHLINTRSESCEGLTYANDLKSISVCLVASCGAVEANVNIIRQTTRRVIKDRDFELTEYKKSSSDDRNHDVLMVR